MPGSLEPPLKKPKVEQKVEQKADQEEDQQLIERKWVKVDGSEEQKNPRFLKVMQWNSLADGKRSPGAWQNSMSLHYVLNQRVVTGSWTKPDLHEKREVGCQAYICSAAICSPIRSLHVICGWLK